MIPVGVRRVRMSIDALRRCNYSSETVGDHKSVLMDYILGYYKEALNRLPASLCSLIGEAGFCFGFLDPVSNIIANTAAHNATPLQPEREANQEDGGLGKKRKRRSRVGTSIEGKRTGNKSQEASGQRGKAISAETEISSIAARSLQGLATFLTTYFRFLPRSEALRYLRLAKADLVVAVRLIEMDRDTEAFNIHQPITKIALTCAALSVICPKVIGTARAANDLKITRLVYGSLTLASRLNDVSCLLAAQGRLRPHNLQRLAMLYVQGMNGTADPRELMSYAKSRLHLSLSTKKVPLSLDLEVSLKEVLLNRIHGFYLKAISCIPSPCLHSIYHRGLLRAGHCYGPFDPVTNIILNTVWYDTAFPLRKKFKVEMIRDESLSRIECHSLYGLINFATALFPALSTYGAVRYLLFHNADLNSVISRAKVDGYEEAIPLSYAYKAAALAAKHPDPTALANMATGLFLEKGKILESLLKDKHNLSPDFVRTISVSFSEYGTRSKPVGCVQKLTSHASQIVSSAREEFEVHQSSICKRVRAALRYYAQLEGNDYELLAVCGANGEIPEDGKSGCFENYDGYPYCHINIWARLKGSQHADAAPTLLFIQCSNDSAHIYNNFLCIPVSESSKDAGRCFHCEYDGIKIVHPSLHTYLGQSFDFEEMACGEHSETMDDLVSHSKLMNLSLPEDDYIYFDPAWDADMVVGLNRVADMEAGKDMDLVRAQSSMVKEVLREMVAFINQDK